MSSDIAIKVEGLSKSFRIGAREARYRTFRDTLTRSVTAPFRRVSALFRGEGYGASDLSETIWALKDVSFEVRRGEVIGIIGANGAGKSTLLKILSRITEPTEGWADIHGRVGSLLEVGTGFHLELSGRDNVILNGSILGMKRAEILNKMDEIVAFAEIEKFLDTPVKHYSSGMYVRLAFAVAAHLDPEILIVDEVLAVGDAAFQKKCLGKMSEVAGQGRTVAFVSHNMNAVSQLCSSALLLNQGTATARGEVGEIVAKYLGATIGEMDSARDAVSYLNPELQIGEILVNGRTSRILHLPADSDRLTIEVTGVVHEEIPMELEAHFRDMTGLPLAFYCPGHFAEAPTRFCAGPFRISRTLQLPFMTRGDYLLDIDLTHPTKCYWMKAPAACRLAVAGCSTPSGAIIEYGRGNGWVLLR
jgi:lipopolysaccharide transport system ATP-binding protein